MIMRSIKHGTDDMPYRQLCAAGVRRHNYFEQDDKSENQSCLP